MSAALAASAVLILFTGATLLADTLKGVRQALPIVGLAAALFAVFVELARFDHGYTEAFFWIGWVGAPVVAIFGGASWGTRRFYGWPDLGAHPSRAGFVAAAIIAGVMVGVGFQSGDVEASKADAESLAHEITAWQTAHGSALPASLSDVRAPVPPTHMGALDPPPFRYGTTRSGGPALGIPLGGTAWLVLDVASGTWARQGRPPRPLPSAREDRSADDGEGGR